MIQFIKAQYKAWRKARVISRFRLDNRKAKWSNVWEESGEKEYFAARLQILIDKCETYNQFYRCQKLLYAKYSPFNGKYDGWIFFGNKISITARGLRIAVDDLKSALG